MQTFNVQQEFQGGYTTTRNRTPYIVVHHAAALYPTGAGIDDVRAVARYHTVNRGWPGIGYHICLAELTQGGEIARYNVSALNLQRAHILNMNDVCVGVSCLTNFVTLPEQKWVIALAEVIRELKQFYPNAQIVGHKEIAVAAGATTCPGPRWLEWKPRLLELVEGAAVPPVVASYQAAWGSQPVNWGYGIPQLYKKEHEAGRKLGKALGPEFPLDGGGVVQAFELGDIRWSPVYGAKVLRV